MEKGHTIPLYSEQGYVRYVDHLGSDLRIVEAARVSYGSPSKGEEQDKKLLHYLYKNRHTSPFEQASITFNIKMPIFIMRQFVRHRTARLNEVSARYTELPENFFLPVVWRKQDLKNKQGSLWVNDMHDWHEQNTKIAMQAYETSWKSYQALLARGVAKELARIVLPVGIFTEIYVNFDVHNLIHFLKLRIDPHAQKEAQELGFAMLQIMEALFPWTAEAFHKYKIKIVEEEDGILWVK